MDGQGSSREEQSEDVAAYLQGFVAVGLEEMILAGANEETKSDWRNEAFGDISHGDHGDHGEARAEGKTDSISTDSGQLCSVAFLFDRSGGWGVQQSKLVCAVRISKLMQAPGGLVLQGQEIQFDVPQ